MHSKPTNILLYGKGVFTTIAFRNAEPFLWEKHWTRINAHAATLGLDISQYSESSVLDAIKKMVDDRGSSRGRVRVSFLDESTSQLWGNGRISETTLHVVAGEARQTPLDLRLTVSSHLINTTSPLAGLKSCNYLDPLMAIESAKDAGFDEAIRPNERGEVASGCMANVFWLKGERLFTPSLRTGCLAGTTREFILENLECEEVEVGIGSLRDADDIFLSSAGIGVAQAAEFEGRKLKNSAHAILGLLPF